MQSDHNTPISDSPPPSSEAILRAALIAILACEDDGYYSDKDFEVLAESDEISAADRARAKAIVQARAALAASSPSDCSDVENAAYGTACMEMLEWRVRCQKAEQAAENVIHEQVLTMQCAYMDAAKNGARTGMLWIENKLRLLGMVPDLTVSAQEYYDQNSKFLVKS